MFSNITVSEYVFGVKIETYCYSAVQYENLRVLARAIRQSFTSSNINFINYIGNMSAPSNSDNMDTYSIHINKRPNRRWAKTICKVIKVACETLKPLNVTCFKVIIGDFEFIYKVLFIEWLDNDDKYQGFRVIYEEGFNFPQEDIEAWGEIFKTSITNEKIWSMKRRNTGQVSKSMRVKVFEEDGFTCCLCGRSRTRHPDIELHIHHKKPVSKGGDNSRENLQTLCLDCNIGKSDTWVDTD
ncbi:MAG: HNH endonuclease [Oscillospiraceae bacterium]|jgi:hypothetical protein|nr:HNH endonuclease [Oscillospiraceae bacterium]